MSFDDIKAKAKPREVRVRVLLNDELLHEHARLEREMVSLSQEELGNRTRASIAAQIEALEAQIAEAEDEFVFRSMGASRWYGLMAEHPPRPDDKQIDPTASFNSDTFPVAAMAECCVQPEMSEDDVRWLYDNAPLGEWRKLWGSCLDANIVAADRPKSLIASGLLQLNGTSSNTADHGESLAASS